MRPETNGRVPGLQPTGELPANQAPVQLGSHSPWHMALPGPRAGFPDPAGASSSSHPALRPS